MFLRKLFSKKPKQEDGERPVATETGIKIDDSPTRPFQEVTMPLPDLPLIAPDHHPYQLLVGYGYSIGLHRQKNQDSIYTFTATLASNDTATPFGLYIVADGMGGHELGEVASGSAVRAVGNYVLEHVYFPLLKDNLAPPNIEEVLQNAVNQARQMVIENAPDGGTTLTIALVVGTTLHIAHIGDSRAYLLHTQGDMDVITRDHSLVKRLEELGQITAEEAAVHPQRNILYRALGQGEQTEPELTRHSLPSCGYVLLCSDGLWGVVSPEQIVQIVSRAPNPVQACDELIEAANAGGGPDNISLILVQVVKQVSQRIERPGGEQKDEA